jgi:plastocyanin
MKRFKNLALAFLAGGAVACAGVTSYAAQHSIMEKGKVFSEKELTIKVGDTLLFVNDDNIAHNVLSTSPDNSFDLGLLQPGSSRPVTFNTPGDVPIICAIHPSMKMIVKVVN